MSRISNLEVIHRANLILHGRDPRNQGRYQILSSIIRKRAVGFLGHIIREPKEWEHVNKITLSVDLKIVEKSYKRVGRPRFYWINETMKHAYELKRAHKKREHRVFNINNDKQRGTLNKSALKREYPFNKQRKPRIKKITKKPHANAQQQQQEGRERGQTDPSQQDQRPHPGGTPGTSPRHTKGSEEGHKEGEGQHQDQHHHHRDNQQSPNRENGNQPRHENDPNHSRDKESRKEPRHPGQGREETNVPYRAKIVLQNLEKHFATLGLVPTTSIPDVRKMYKRQALIHHPDKGGDPQKFRETKFAHDTIVTKVKKLLELFPEAAGLVL